MDKQPGLVATSWSYSIECNHATTWRERLGNHLRRLAGRIDGRESMAFRMHAQPPLDAATRLAVYKQGFKTIEQSLSASAQAAAEEQLLRELHPELFRVRRRG